MRRISRLIAGLCVLGSAACASDGILAPQIAPASEPLAAAAVASGPIADEDPKALVSSAPSVVIRCGGTIRSDAGEPIFIVDGVIRNREDLSALVAADIEKIEVLRGPDAIFTYGAQAENGVVLITMRRRG